MSVLTIKHSAGPFDIRVTDGTAFLSSRFDRNSRNTTLGEPSGWIDFAQVVVQMDDHDKLSQQGISNLNLFRSAPALLQITIDFVIAHGRRGGVYDQLLPADQQDSLVRDAMSAVEAALSGELP